MESLSLASTCLILGAGASAHLGYPVGAELLSRICNRLTDYVRELDEQPLQEHWRAPLGLPVEELERSKLAGLLSGLALSSASSPDAFLQQHPEFLRLGKAFITERLSEVERRRTLFQRETHEWYGLLRDWILPDKASDRPLQNVSIVTFNYDRSIDAFLHLAIQWKYSLPSEDAWHLLREWIPIVHLHGMLAPYPRIPYGDVKDFGEDLRAGDSIRIISEIGELKDGFCTPEFKRANQLLEESTRIVSLGFSFGDVNVGRLRYFPAGLSDGKSAIAIIGAMTAEDLSSAKEAIARQCGPIKILSGKCGVRCFSLRGQSSVLFLDG